MCKSIGASYGRTYKHIVLQLAIGHAMHGVRAVFLLIYLKQSMKNRLSMKQISSDE